jgi:Flp pilus assembly protein TadG
MTLSKAAISRRSFWAGFLRDRRGVVGVALAVLLPVLIGFAGLGVEVGWWFAIQRQNQSAADAAAISAALEYAAHIENSVMTNPTAAANTTANYNLFSTSPPNTLTLYLCYGFTVGSLCNTSTSSGAVPNAVQVVLTQPLNTSFASFVTAIWGPSVNTVNVTTTAIAAFRPTNSQTCQPGQPCQVYLAM